MSRYSWQHLDPTVHTEIEACTDTVLAVHPHEGNAQSDVIATLDLASRTRAVIKGAHWPDGHPAPPLAVRLCKEALVLDTIPGAFAPRLIEAVDCAGWLILILEHIPGSPPTLTPGSPDVPAVAKTLATLAARPQLVPSSMRTMPNMSYMWLGTRPWRVLRHVRPRLHGWVLALIDEWADREVDYIRLCDGDALMHTAIRRKDLLITTRDVSVLDWTHAQAAPPWVDLAKFAVMLVEHGHSPNDAEEMVAPARAWTAADQAAVTAHAVLSYGLAEWQRLTRTTPDSAVTARADAWLRWLHYRWHRFPVRDTRFHSSSGTGVG